MAFTGRKLDIVIVRENIEDLYAGIEYMQTPGVAEGLKLISREGCEKIVKLAFAFAIASLVFVLAMTLSGGVLATWGGADQAANQVADHGYVSRASVVWGTRAAPVRLKSLGRDSNRICDPASRRTSATLLGSSDGHYWILVRTLNDQNDRTKSRKVMRVPANDYALSFAKTIGPKGDSVGRACSRTGR